MEEKLKSVAADDRIFVSVMVILVAVASFLLGRMSVGQVVTMRTAGGGAAPAVVAMTYTGSAAEVIATGTKSVSVASVPGSPKTVDAPLGTVMGLYVASKSGTKYHHRDCAGAKRIKDENRIYFATEDEARAAGYEPAANCSQLNN